MRGRMQGVRDEATPYGVVEEWQRSSRPRSAEPEGRGGLASIARRPVVRSPAPPPSSAFDQGDSSRFVSRRPRAFFNGLLHPPRESSHAPSKRRGAASGYLDAEPPERRLQ